ncbi:LETM1 domain-containing protein 1 [Tribolium madens]|uniref:LETM1 domain-containing protein 1 n=1 Tax=Tribolium madens TaxID=41895 RepID=UPI001CF739EF|nr:LETM1 domain-containing protein 1 [Tribolium madens]
MTQALLNRCRMQSFSLFPLLKPPKMPPVTHFHTTPIPHRKSLYKTESKKIRFFVVHRYLEYLKNYDKVLERSFPGAMRVYRVFTVGIKDFARDLKDYFRIVRILNSPTKGKFKSLTRREIELYHQMPKDMLKVAPVLLISALPLANYVIFPLAYLFPRVFLSRHFWNLQQRAEFNILDLRSRLVNNRPLFRCVQAELDKIRGHRLFCKWAEVLGMMGSGVQPKVEQILECKDLFTCEPYHLFYLKGKHVKHLLRIHDLHMGWFRRSRLIERAVILQEMDKAIIREGGVHNMPQDALKNACYIRGLNPMNMRNEDMIDWLNNWIKISNVVDRESWSLLLHCPILLAYNEPSNWTLIYKTK